MSDHNNIVPFENLTLKMQQKMYPLSKRVRFKKGDTPFANDALSRYFYVIEKGAIKSFQLNLKNAKEQTIFMLRAGDMLDTLILLDGQPHDVMYEAMEETDVFEIPIEKVRALILKNPEFNQIFFPYLAKQIRHMEELATDMSLYSTEERLVKLLIQNLDPSNTLKYKIIHGLSHTEIAKLIGTVRHVVERHLKKLKADGLLESKSKELKILDAKKLLEKINLF